jgi:RNA polymerase subunit RPABC4/transcription elongation factor Spt4
VTSSFFGGIHGFFQSATWVAIQLFGGLFLLLVWAATVYWVRKDAKRRIESPALIQLVTLLGAVPPFFGPLVYMLFRPPEYLEDIRERRLEIQAIERRLEERDCPVCHAQVDTDFLVCPVCATRLRHACVSCVRPLDSAWLVCPYCETPVEPEDAPGVWPSSAAVTDSSLPVARSTRSSRASSRKAT